MNELDLATAAFLNEFARVSPLFDQTLVAVSHNLFLKGGICSVLLWWLWFGSKGETETVRERILAAMLGSVAGIFLARMLASVTAFRLRPLHNRDLDFLLPVGLSETVLSNWSSFPSDHAVLFFTVGTGIWLVSKRIGGLLLLYISVVICFPRLYLGFHYLSDILVGAGMGVGVALYFNSKRVMGLLVSPLLGWSERAPEPFYAGFFFLTYQLGRMFMDLRDLATYGVRILRLFLQ